LVPAGEIAFADHMADPLKRAGPFVRRMQGIALLGDCRKAHDLPILLRQHMADEIIPRVKPEGRLHRAGKATDPDAISGRAAVC
jgi:hypothetical protein